ncbi:SPFH domain-containing protein [Pedobacter flavus]|uniref:SPFH domain-containing protein n=1 Tax=Pedobacter flavus TaxID=3113906 RepID=A0ABU7H238_9SPHI|nr:SPFH domain-containing protein [Pedobacter sp. VNH31]MEE1885330.1 SPFH domain-containing protein [Pedobacter sp. VNH31]
MSATTIILIILAVFVLVAFMSTFKVVPQRSVYIVERLGKYSRTLDAGFHILIPFIDKVAYRQNLKEQAIDVASQICITKDNIAVEVDGILYLQVVDPQKASYGIDNYRFAVIQISQTTMRSVIGRMELDKTFEERETVNATIVEAVDKASESWGIKVSRYEVKNISPPQSIRDAMEKQMRAEREKRAMIAESEGDKQAKINRAEGDKQEAIARSEGEKMRKINEAAGTASEIEMVAFATAKGIVEIAKSINAEGGMNAVNLRIAEQYLSEFGKLAKTNNSMIVPADLSDIAGVLSSITNVIGKSNLELPTMQSTKPPRQK